ncbi:hypothetical protein BN946_scf185016.g5 [Trametes cinnabarina]|uniref:G-protein coupled receptors family 1 profile domain-containing protein n=1 Tax=Pycnoporus cinnabarinus TaxID=5643 RepID=A0A060SN61_PYCCI|nr:hypothetical protein BN946_scf185016.g5 [Trametes cinnabarina]
MALFQNAYYIGNNFNTILYGIMLVLYFRIVHIMLSPRHKHARSDKFFLFFSTALLCLNTVFVATEAVFGEEMWIIHADYPGGQDAYLEDYASVWYQTLGTAASIILNLLSDGLLIYRCWVVWDDVRIVVFPIILYLGAFSVGIAQLYESGRPHANYFAGLAANLGIAYTSSVISLNIIVTGLICGRIYYAGRRSARTLGVVVGTEYMSAASMVVESALLYTITGVAYLISFALNSQIDIFFLSLYVMMTCIAPLMIVLRVVSGRAWTRDRSTMTSTNIAFSNTAHRTNSELDLGDESPTKESGGNDELTKQSNASTMVV